MSSPGASRRRRFYPESYPTRVKGQGYERLAARVRSGRHDAHSKAVLRVLGQLYLVGALSGPPYRASIEAETELENTPRRPSGAGRRRL
jgi:hypothetical protein